MFFSFKFLTLMDCVMELLEHILDFSSAILLSHNVNGIRRYQ